MATVGVRKIIASGSYTVLRDEALRFEVQGVPVEVTFENDGGEMNAVPTFENGIIAVRVQNANSPLGAGFELTGLRINAVELQIAVVIHSVGGNGMYKVVSFTAS